MFEEVIIQQNPHWQNHLYDAGLQRDVFKKLIQVMETRQIISIIGVRRAGKSTLLKQLINHLISKDKVNPKNILFLNLEHPYFASYAQNVENLQKIFEDFLKIADPKGLIYCCLDEIQFFAKWPIFVKALYEQKKVKFIITGSNSSLLSSELMTLLSGRTIPLEIFPFSYHELAQKTGLEVNLLSLSQNKPKFRKLFDDYLKLGGFPEVVLTKSEANSFEILNTYPKSIIYQDVAPRLSLKKSTELENLYLYLISNLGVNFSYKNLSTLFDLTDKTIKEYIQAFQESKLLFLIERFSFSVKKQLRLPKKIYSIDTGLTNATAFKFSENEGRLLENIVFLEMKRRNINLYYYKTKNDLEIDFIAKEKELSCFQVALDLNNPATLEREVKALKEGLKELKLKTGTIITLNEEAIIEDEFKISIIPIYKFLLQPYLDKPEEP